MEEPLEGRLGLGLKIHSLKIQSFIQPSLPKGG